MSRTGLGHKAVEAATRTTSDLGEFAAIAATYDVDRVNDRIRFGAFANTIARWQQSGKRVPAALGPPRRGVQRDRVRRRQPGSTRGLALDEGRPCLPLVGYLTVNSRKRADITDLLELDLFEISIVPSPANPHTRILEMKSMAVEQRNLRRRSDEVALEAALGWQPVSTFVEPEAESGPTDAELREQAKALGLPVPPPREGTAARFRSGLDPTGEQLVKDLNAVRQGRGDTPQGKFARIKIASFEV